MIKSNFGWRFAANTFLGCLCVGWILVASNAEGRSIRWLPSYGRPQAVANDGTVVTPSGVVLPDGRYLEPQVDPQGWAVLYDVSADGSIVATWVGTWGYYDYWRAAVWVHGRLFDIGSLGRQESEALDVSGDGRIVVGSAWDRYYYQEQGYRWRYGKTNYIAFVWTPDSGIRPLQELFGDLLASGSLLLTADAISPNGRYILGTGYDASSQRSGPFLIDTW